MQGIDGDAVLAPCDGNAKIERYAGSVRGILEGKMQTSGTVKNIAKSRTLRTKRVPVLFPGMTFRKQCIRSTTWREGYVEVDVPN